MGSEEMGAKIPDTTNPVPLPTVGDKEFGLMLEKLRPNLMRFAMAKTRGDLHFAQDLVQTTLLKAWGNREKFDGRNLKAWLFTILHNALISDVRSLRSRGTATGEIAEKALETAETQGNQDSSWRLRETLRHIGKLPPEQQAAIKAIGIGRNYDEVAKKLKVPIGTVRSRVNRARAALEKMRDTEALPDKDIDNPDEPSALE